jgi:serine phosphatase RsbU (regulator of sigma subunit)
MKINIKITAILVPLFLCISGFAQHELIDSLKTALKSAKDGEEKTRLFIKLSFAYNSYQLDSSDLYAEKAVEATKNTTSLIAASALSAYADACYFKLNRSKRDSLISKSLQLYTQLKDNYGIVDTRLKIAGYVKFDGNLKESLTGYIAVNKEAAKNHFTKIEAWTDIYISEIYIELSKFKEALSSALLGLNKMQKINFFRGIAESSSNLGLAYDMMGEADSAIHYYKVSIEAASKENLVNILANSYSNIGVVYFYSKNYSKAIENFELALKLNEKLDYPESRANNLLNLGEVYQEQKKYADAEKYMIEGLSILEKTKNLVYRKEAYRMMAVLYDKVGKQDKAYKYHLRYTEISDSLYNANSTKAVAEMQVQFDTEKKQKEIEIQNAKLDSQKAQLKEEQFQRLALYSGLGFVVVLGAFIYNRLTVTRKQKLEVEVQKKEVEKQKYIIEEHQKDIVDSINYAKRIQYALLAHEELLNDNLPQHFVFFKPKDIVSGDFYWATHTHSKENKDLFYLAVCDSTGHGVPGAFMSLLNIGFLSEAIKEKGIFKPHEVLNYVRQRLITSIGQGDQKDGMDCILIKIDGQELKNNKGVLKIEYAAANNEPILIRENKIIELPKDKMPVGKGERIEFFTLQTIELQKGDFLYLYTDGFADQFGGAKGKKFKYKQLNEMLLANHAKPAQEQKELLFDAFEKWKGNLEQVDDVCIIGIKI